MDYKIPWCDIDHAQYVEAVARQGVRVPAYPDYLHSTHWEITCEEKIGRCALGGELTRTQLHHVSYENLGNEQPGDLIELCDRCHWWHSQRAA